MKKIPLIDLIKYFLYVGTTIYGGPLAIIDNFRKDMVEKKKWINQDEFSNIFAYTQVAPGPISYQFCVYFSYFKNGFWAALFSGIALIIPSFVLMLIFSVSYQFYGKNTYYVNFLYGISPVVIAIILHSGFNLGKSIFKKDFFLYLVASISLLFTVFFKFHIIFTVLALGIITILYYSVINNKKLSSVSIPVILIFIGKLFLLLQEAKFFLFKLALVFLKVGALTYGSGYVIVGALQQEIVQNYGWLTAKEFIDGIAFGNITPGPVVITSTFIGYMTSGIPGSIVATSAIFLPTFIFVILIAGRIKKFEKNFYLQSFLKGINAAAIGAILATAVFLSKDSIVDVPGIVLFVSSLIVLFFARLKTLYLIIIGGILGIVIRMIF